MLLVTGPAYVDTLMRVPQLAEEGKKMRGTIVRKSPGGGAVNTSAWLAASGVPVRLVSARGADSDGEHIAADCEGIDLSVTWLPAESTPLAWVIVPAGGDRTIYTSGAPAVDPAVLGAVCVGGTFVWSAWRDETLRWAAAGDAPLRGCDLSFLAAEHAAGHEWQLVVGSHHDAAEGVDEALLAACGVRWCVMTEGAAGGRYWTPGDGWHHYAPAPLAEGFHDTCGAGDAFLAGLLAGLYAEESLKDACARGAMTAARCLRQPGSFPHVTASR